MSWAQPEQIEFLNSRVQEFQDSMDSKSDQTKFWERLRTDWKAKWDLSAKQSKRFSTHFRQEMRNRGADRKAVNKATKPAEKAAPKRTPRITPSGKPTPRIIPGDLIEVHRQRSRSPSSSDYSPTAAQSPLRVQSPTPAKDSPTAVSSDLFGDSPAPTPHTHVSTELVPSSQSPGVPVLPPARVWSRELTKSLAFHLELPGIARDDVDLIVQGQMLSVSAQTNNVAYQWSKDVGGQVVPESVRAGLADGELRIIVNVDCTVEVNKNWTNFHVSEPPILY
ncbi:hypothetical protein PTI98_009355 [Pleurotus ostreatus]|nr:hypothetical protein PTI98_009355 [Pleurotus ostreatus]